MVPINAMIQLGICEYLKLNRKRFEIISASLLSELDPSIHAISQLTRSLSNTGEKKYLLHILERLVLQLNATGAYVREVKV